jgi:anion-transporting  ArsA/GET3 family ATPase
VSPSRPASRPAATTLPELVAAKEMLLACGAGGVGKTTTAAALATQAAAALDRRVLVVTVDPARRLATALGLAGVSDEPQVVAREALADAAGGVAPAGELSVAMLDTKRGWDALIRRYAPDARVRDTILSNPLYDSITARFVQSHDYLAMERLHELHASGRYDLVVVDTPPSRSALDILDAPERMADFFGSRLLRWLTVPYRSRIFAAASKPFYQVADRILGSKFLQDIAEFFVLFQTMEAGFVRRAREVTALLGDERTTFVVVSTLEPVPVREAEFLMTELARRRLPLGALVLNKVLPAWLREPAGAMAASTVAADPGAVARPVAAALGGLDEARLTSVLAESAASFTRLALAADREAAEQARLAARPAVTVAVPHVPRDVTDLTGLVALGRSLWGVPEPARPRRARRSDTRR